MSWKTDVKQMSTQQYDRETIKCTVDIYRLSTHQQTDDDDEVLVKVIKI